jgi:2'-deoxynucleoside 5'-phosphate N-hydrolase
MRIYFAGSIRGGRGDAALYAQIIAHLQGLKDAEGAQHSVLTEHVGSSEIGPMGESVGESARTEADIYTRDMEWLRSADCVVAEVTQPSLGVGYEIGYAHAQLNIPILCLFRPGGEADGSSDSTKRSLSAMIRGAIDGKNLEVVDYAGLEGATEAIDAWLKKQQSPSQQQ